jgi:hypothetical protein
MIRRISSYSVIASAGSGLNVPLTLISSNLGTLLFTGTAYVTGGPSRFFIGRPIASAMFASFKSLSFRCLTSDRTNSSSVHLIEQGKSEPHPARLKELLKQVELLSF